MYKQAKEGRIGIYKTDKDGDFVRLTNFAARISRETLVVDGEKRQRLYEVLGIVEAGEGEEPGELPAAEIPASQLSSTNWISNQWGADAIVFPTATAQDLQVSILLESKDREKRTVYAATGWTDKGFVSAGGMVTGTTWKPEEEVRLPRELMPTKLPDPASVTPESIRSISTIIKACGSELGWLLIAAALTPPLLTPDFAIHVTGRTGTFKSEVTSLAQSFWGEYDARNLPCSWSSTANALEALCYYARDTLTVVDDFIPVGTSYQQRSYQKAADNLIRNAGNQQGRQRLTDTSTLQQTMYPRSLILSTGEDTPEGHSCRGRMIITEIEVGQVKPERLSEAQAVRGEWPKVTAAWIKWIQKNDGRKRASELRKKERDARLGIGHARTPNALAALSVTVQLFLEFAVEFDALSVAQANAAKQQADRSLDKIGQRQASYITQADPCAIFCETLRTVMATKAGHIKDINGGTPRRDAQNLGWKIDHSTQPPTYAASGPTLGWMSGDEQSVYLDAALIYETLRRHSRGAITFTKPTLFKRLKEGGLLNAIDEQRQRNTVRVTAEGAVRTVLSIPSAKVKSEE